MRLFGCALFALIIIAAFSLAPADAAVIYRETFGRPVTDSFPDADGQGNIPGNIYDWPTFRATAAGGNALLQTVGSNASGVSGNAAAGQPSDLVNVNAGTNSDGTTGAYPRGLFFMAQQEQAPKLAWTSEFSFNPAAYTSVTFGWRQGNDSDASPFHLAVRIAGQWYVNATAVNSVGYPDGIGNFAASAQAKTVVYDPAAANWLTLAFDGAWNSAANTGTDSTVPLATGAAPGANLSGVIDGFGIYSPVNTGTRRFDTFEINAVPEPASRALVAALGLGALLRRRT